MRLPASVSATGSDTEPAAVTARTGEGVSSIGVDGSAPAVAASSTPRARKNVTSRSSNLACSRSRIMALCWFCISNRTLSSVSWASYSCLIEARMVPSKNMWVNSRGVRGPESSVCT